MLAGLLRHGETEGGSRFRGSIDDPLTGRGWFQMWSAMEKTGPPWDRIITSPLARCAEFAHALAQRRALPCSLDERLREMHFGVWEGRSAAELMTTDAAALARFWSDPVRNTPPGAEPLTGFAARVLSAWRDIIAGHAGEKVLLITHGGVMRVILGHVMQQPLERLLEVEVPHGALRRIRIEHTRKPVRYVLEGEPA